MNSLPPAGLEGQDLALRSQMDGAGTLTNSPGAWGQNVSGSEGTKEVESKEGAGSPREDPRVPDQPRPSHSVGAACVQVEGSRDGPACAALLRLGKSLTLLELSVLFWKVWAGAVP